MLTRNLPATAAMSISVFAVAAMMATAPAAAQSSDGAASSDGRGLSRDATLNPGDIVVTAQKREERLMDVPIAITAVTGAEIEDKGYTNIADLLQRSPGVSVTGGSIQIRGISSIFGSATVGYYLDELPFSFLLSTVSPDIRAWDLERVEVLRGPQGTLYGANSIGGTIRTLTKNPNLSRFEAKAEGSVGSVKDGKREWEVKGAINAPIVEDRIAIRLAGTKYKNGGFVDSPLGKDIDDSEVTTWRGKLALAPFEGTRVTLSAWSQETENDNASTAGRNRVSATTAPSPSSNEFRTYGGVIEQEGPGFDIVSATSYLRYEASSQTSGNLGAGIVLIGSSNVAKTFSQEVRLVSSGTGPMRWTAGGYYQHSKEHAASTIPGFFDSDNNDSSKAWAAFGEAGYKFGDFDATAGLRYFHDKRVSESVLTGFPPLPSVKSSYDTFNPKFNLSWHTSPQSLFYGTVAKGFRSGQNQPAVSVFTAALFGISVPTTIDPETLWSYEIGNKSTLLDGKLTVETALYYNDWKDLQVTIVAGGALGALVNAGKAHSFGADLAVTYRPLTGLSLAVSGNVNESKLDSSVPTAFNKGDRIVNVPRYTVNASATYTTPLTDSLNLFSFAELQQGAKRILNAQGLSGQSSPQSIVNARIGVEADHWGVYLTASNLLDERGFTYPVLSTTNFEGSIPRPRTVGVLLRANY